MGGGGGGWGSIAIENSVKQTEVVILETYTSSEEPNSVFHDNAWT